MLPGNVFMWSTTAGTNIEKLVLGNTFSLLTSISETVGPKPETKYRTIKFVNWHFQEKMYLHT